MMADWIAKGDTALPLSPLPLAGEGAERSEAGEGPSPGSQLRCSPPSPRFAGRGEGEREALPLDLGKIRHRPCRLPDFVQQLEAILAHRLVVRIHGNLVEERIDDRT